MKCPNCNQETSELEEKCKNCGINFEEYEKTHKEKNENEFEYGGKTVFLNFINVVQLIGFIIIAIISYNKGEIGFAVLYIIIGTITFAFIKGFANIIDLLDSINQKMDN